MKKFLKSTAALTLLFATTTGMANDPKISLAQGIDVKSLILELDSQVRASDIKMINEDAQTIYAEHIDDANYTKKFNLKDLAVGTYYFSIENALTSVVYTLNVERKAVKISHKKENATKPVFRKIGKKVSINLFNADQQKVDIEIVDNRNNIVFKESTLGELIIGKAFNFEKAIKGAYTISVNDGEETYYQKIIIG